MWTEHFAHSPGQCALALTRDALLTIGPDLCLNKYDLPLNPADSQPTVIRPHAGSATCIAIPPTINGMVVTGGTDGAVAAHTLPDLHLDRIALQFSLPVRCCAVSSQGRFIAAGGDDCDVKVVDTVSDQLHTLTGHRAAVIGVALSERAPLIATAGRDGETRLWRLDGRQAECIGCHRGMRPVSSCIGLAWNHNGTHVAIPGGSNVLIFNDQLQVVQQWEAQHQVIGVVYSKHFLFSYGTDGSVHVLHPDSGLLLMAYDKIVECSILGLVVSLDEQSIYIVLHLSISLSSHFIDWRGWHVEGNNQ